jgi:hypothetical protein
MDANLLDVTAFLDDAHLSTDGRTLRYRGRDYDLTAGVLRLVESAEYVQGNFTKLRERHATLQLDSSMKLFEYMALGKAILCSICPCCTKCLTSRLACSFRVRTSRRGRMPLPAWMMIAIDFGHLANVRGCAFSTATRGSSGRSVY